ncbi:MAG: tryptophan--tRNA ligase [Oligoflexia bacterium]|nr:tryptophan--tRNA ligase [Oligoflexia bacterium]
MKSNTKRSLTGIRASGNIHLGNYLGMIKPALDKQSQYECLYFIADLHSLTTNHDPQLIRRYSYDAVATWLAFGLDIKRNLIYRQSDLPMVTELAWFLSCTTGFGFLEKGHAFKDALAQNKDVNHGVFAYPVLMAADILLYAPDIVPVGKDQKQHVEMARDMAGSFNAIYGDILKLPEVVVDERVMLIPGLDGRKMSKSYGNEIPVFCSKEELRKKILSIKTDSTPLEQPKKLEGSLLNDLFKLFATDSQYQDLSKRLAAGGLGWGHAKEELFGVIDSALAAARDRYNQLRSDEGALDQVLRDGAERAFAIATPVLNSVRVAAGFNSSALHL